MSDEEIEVQEPPVDEMLLMRLNDCATSTRLGMTDRGFPDYMRRLLGLGYVKPIGEGYRITDAGLAHLCQHRELLQRM